jgi:acetyl-CoA acyltransferase
MNEAFICDAIRTPVGKFGGTLSSVRADDLAAIPLKALMDRNPKADWCTVDDVLMGCANQAGEDNRNVARMALLIAGLPHTVPGATINRLCGSGMDAVGTAARIIRAGEAEMMIAGGVESMTRAPFVMAKAAAAFSRSMEVFDTTLGWRFVNQRLKSLYGTESMMETAENIASDYKISREDQDKFACLSQIKCNQARANGLLADEIIPVIIPQSKGEQMVFKEDEHPRLTTLEKLGALKPLTHENGTITAGNSSGINDGAAALIIASEAAINKYHLTPIARISGMETAGVLPRIMGMGPVPATRKLLARLKLSLDAIDIIELNEAFAAQALGCIRELGLADDDPRINSLGGAIAYGHPLGMSGARLLTTASYQLKRSNQKRALCTMCIGVGQGISIIIEKV